MPAARIGVHQLSLGPKGPGGHNSSMPPLSQNYRGGNYCVDNDAGFPVISKEQPVLLKELRRKHEGLAPVEFVF